MTWPERLCTQSQILTISMTTNHQNRSESSWILTTNWMCSLSRFVNFHIRIGSYFPSISTCRESRTTDEGVVLSVSTNGGITWSTLDTYSYLSYRSTKAIGVTLPAAARSAATLFRWWQPYFTRAGDDQWAIDEVVIGGSLVSK